MRTQGRARRGLAGHPAKIMRKLLHGRQAVLTSDVEGQPSEEEIYNKYQDIKADIKKNMKYITNKNQQKRALLDWIYNETGNHIVDLNRRDASVGWLLNRLAGARLQKFYKWEDNHHF